MLSDGVIQKCLANGKLGIDPYPDDIQFQPASVDLRLGGEVIHYRTGLRHGIKYSPLVIQPGEQYLGSTVETVTLPDNVIARVEGKSSWGRKFLAIHSTAGFIDPGFSGEITLEIMNLGCHPVAVTYNTAICQISFDWLDVPALRPYGHAELGSHYQNQKGPTSAR